MSAAEAKRISKVKRKGSTAIAAVPPAPPGAVGTAHAAGLQGGTRGSEGCLRGVPEGKSLHSRVPAYLGVIPVPLR